MAEPFFCLNTSTIRPTPLLDKVRTAAEAGYQGIEPWNDEIDAYLLGGGTLGALASALSESGLRVVSMIALGGWVTTEGADYRRALEECRRRMGQAAALGCRSIVASPPQEAVDLGRVAERFGDLVRLGLKEGVAPSMEFLGFVDGVHTLADAWAVASGCGEPGAAVVADVFHLLRGGGSLDDLLTVPGDRLSCFHLNDVPARPDVRTQADEDRVMIGDGVADLARVVANLRAIGYRGPVSLELFNRTLWDRDPAEVAALGLARMRALFEGGA